MPGGDRTGPMGMGPMTGRGAGYCGGAGAPGFASAGQRGLGGGGRGRGGRGRRNRFLATGLTGWQRAAMNEPDAAPTAMASDTVSEAEELQTLKAQAEAAAATLDHVRRRIDELTNTPDVDSP